VTSRLCLNAWKGCTNLWYKRFRVQKKWVTSAIFKKYLQYVLAARILIVDFVLCTLAVKKKSGLVSTCRIGQFPCESYVTTGGQSATYVVWFGPIEKHMRCPAMDICEPHRKHIFLYFIYKRCIATEVIRLLPAYRCWGNMFTKSLPSNGSTFHACASFQISTLIRFTYSCSWYVRLLFSNRFTSRKCLHSCFVVNTTAHSNYISACRHIERHLIVDWF
jgi:hypothetical protein